MRSALAIVVAVAAVGGGARASAPDVFGFGAEESAVAGASAARVHDATAGFYNPAGLARLTRSEASFGVFVYGSRLTINGKPAPLDNANGLITGAAAPVPLGGFLADRLFVGIALHVLPDTIVRVIARPPDEPFYPYYDNRTQRLVVLPSLAVRIGHGFSAGIAINYLAGLHGVVAATEGATRAVEARVDEAIGGVARVNAGLLWRSRHDRLAFGASYRQQFSIPFQTVTHNRVAGQPIDLDIDAEGLFTPHELEIGAAARPVEWLWLSADVIAGFWSTWRGPYVTVQSTLPIAGALSAPPPRLRYSDTVSLRLGAEATRPLTPTVDFRLRAGYGFETSPIPATQPGVTNLLDGPKHFLCAGFGAVATVGQSRVRVDVSGQLQVLQPRTLTKTIAPAGTNPDPATALRDELPDDPNRKETLGVQISNPGYPSVSSGGLVWAMSATLTVER